MDILEGRSELKRMSRGSLFTLGANQRISNCLIGARACGFSLHHQGIHFCVSELMGKGCEVELLLSGKKDVEFKVYHRDHLTRSTVFLGKIIERRRKERGDNLKDPLSKAIKQYSDYVEDPSTIFLLG